MSLIFTTLSKAIDSEDSELFESRNTEPKISIEATILDDFRISEEITNFEFNRFQVLWKRFWRKVSEWDVFGFIDEVDDLWNEDREFSDFKREAILGIMTHSLPTVLGSEIEFKLDSVAAMSLDLSFDGSSGETFY